MNIYDDTPETAPKTQSAIGANAATIRAMRSSGEYQRARQRYLNQARAHHNKDGTTGDPCWLCGQPIDYQLKFPHPRSWTLDHAIPITENPNLMLNPSNFRSAHNDCNNSRGNNNPRIELGEPSEIW
jgi:5-methylcytosine-specific restriction endonuclease McrA